MPKAVDTLWLGRVRLRTDAGVSERPVRVRTTGAAPSEDDEVEEIPDPFEAVRRGPSRLQRVADVARGAEAVQGGLRGRVGEVELAPPVVPPKIVCVGRNYREHAAELGNEVPTEPLLFYKPSSSLAGPGDPIRLPAGFERIDMESELVVVVGAFGTELSRSEADAVVLGYTLGNDVSCRDLQKRDKQWTRAKGFDSFAPLGPWIRVAESAGEPPPEARIQGFIDGELRQDAPIGAMVFDVAFVLSYVSEYITLEPGDVIYTGTPEGVSPLSPGQRVQIQLAGWDLGCLSNPVLAR